LSAEDVTSGTAGPGDAHAQPSEEELRAAYEAELSRISTTDMMAQAAVSLLNLGARRLAPAVSDPSTSVGADAGEQRDLEQARDAIDAVKALLDVLERRIAGELGPLRDALSRLQMAYAREIQPGAGAAPTPASQPAAAERQAGAGQPAAGEQQQPGEPAGGRPPGPGPAESSGRLWVPGR
jgi:hypothetical protein